MDADSSTYKKGQNLGVGTHGKNQDETDGIKQYTFTHPNFFMSPLLISESVGELRREIVLR